MHFVIAILIGVFLAYKAVVGGHFSKWRLVHFDPLDITLSVFNRYFYKVETLMGYAFNIELEF